jgi:hypothetical protein
LLSRHSTSQISNTLVDLLGTVDDLHELLLEGSTADQEAVHVGLCVQLVAIGRVGAATVNDAGVVSNSGRDVVL